eukprot:Hpha_TRINITY_DN16579_c0_g14::TRINITY_DN16579_c0_g14_i1::g.133535::m.133535
MGGDAGAYTSMQSQPMVTPMAIVPTAAVGPVQWRAECEPLFPADGHEQEQIPVGSGVTVHGVIVAHERGGAVVVDVAPQTNVSRPIRITLPAQGVRRAVDNTLYSTTACGTELVMVSGGGEASTGCCDTGLWKTARPYKAVPKLFAFFLVSVLSFAAALATFSVSAALLPLYIGLPVFRWSAAVWRWLAHQQLAMLLDLEPLPNRCTLSYPSANIRGGSACDYASQCHTWSCLVFLIVISFPMALTFFTLTMTLLPLSCALMILVIGIPMLVVTTNILSGCMRLLRNTAICCIAKRISDDLAVAPGAVPPPPPVEGQVLCPPVQPVAAPAELRRGEEEDNNSNNSCSNNISDNNGVPFSSEGATSDDWQPSPDEVASVFSGVSVRGAPTVKCEHANAAGAAAEIDVSFQRSTFSRVMSRDRTSEEAAALGRFQTAWARTFGTRQCMLQDIVIAPPRTEGLGPRHFIRVADNVDEARRAQLVKAYKAAFSAMYVHIMDADEQRKHCGPDFSGFFE